VAHHRKKLTFGAVSGIGLLLGQNQSLFDLLRGLEPAKAIGERCQDDTITLFPRFAGGATGKQ